MGKLDEKKKLKEEALLNTAFEFFTSKGFEKTTIDDIVNKAGVGKGTFYLYFKDKYDIRDKLIAHKASRIFGKALMSAFSESIEESFENRIIILTDSIIEQLNDDKSLLTFISKNLNWGIFRNALNVPSDSRYIDFENAYDEMLSHAPFKIMDSEVMLFMIVELVFSTCHSTILYGEPCSLDRLKPYLYTQIRSIIHSFGQADQC